MFMLRGRIFVNLVRLLVLQRAFLSFVWLIYPVVFELFACVRVSAEPFYLHAFVHVMSGPFAVCLCTCRRWTFLALVHRSAESSKLCAFLHAVMDFSVYS